jgi:hypothetical protein
MLTAIPEYYSGASTPDRNDCESTTPSIKAPSMGLPGFTMTRLSALKK